MTKIDGLEIVMTKQMQKMIDKELKKRFEELKPELATRYEELLNMRNMEADQFNDGFNDARAGKLETDHPHYDLDTDNWRLGYAYGMFEPMKEKLAREHQLSDALHARIAELEAENARLKAEQAAPKKDASELISGLDRASLALDALENLLKAEQAEPKVEYNLKVKPSIGFCSERAAKLIDNLGNAAWYYGHSCSFENYTAQIEADAALCDFVARLERREKDFNELVEIVLEVSRYHANMWNEKALLAWRALEKFLNKERQ